jgi:anti-anti-sigma factor
VVTTPSVSTRAFTHTVVIVLRGHIDEQESHRLRHELIDAMMRRRPRHVVVDLSRTISLDPTAVGALIAAHDTAPDMHLTLTLRRPCAVVAAELAEQGLPAAYPGV